MQAGFARQEGRRDNEVEQDCDQRRQKHGREKEHAALDCEINVYGVGITSVDSIYKARILKGSKKISPLLKGFIVRFHLLMIYEQRFSAQIFMND
jgi:hypothetical protein